MLVTVPCTSICCAGDRRPLSWSTTLRARYDGCDGVKVLDAEPEGCIEPEALNETDGMELRVFANEAVHRWLLVARLDNLGKGASGAAVQNLRLMFGI